MKQLSFLITLFLSLAGTSYLPARALDLPKDHAQVAKPATIKVLLMERQPSILLDVKGSYKLFCPHTNVQISSGSSAKKDFLTPGAQGLVWGKLLPAAQSIRVVPSNGEASIFINGIQYKGCVEIFDLGNSLRVINEVDIESYLRSCLATKFFDVSESEVLNSLAIIARTRAYYLAQKETLAPWHITAEAAGYRGQAVTLQNLALEKAIEETRHAILTYENQPFAACYTENSAGKTASFSSIFRSKSPSPEGVILSGMESERLKSAWSFQLPKQELASLLHVEELGSFTPCTEKKSGKVYAVKVRNKDEIKTIEFFSLQKMIGKEKLKSNDFTVEVANEVVRFSGYGEGFGVGLCIYAANMMAKQGLDAKRILSEFYSQTTLEKHRSLVEKSKI